jgi:hypothetical protein
MKRALLLSLALAMSAQAAWAQVTVLPIGKNATNQYSPSNPGCQELDINGLTYSAANPVPVQLSQANVAVGTASPLAVQIGNGTSQLSGLVANTVNALPVVMGNSSVATYGFSSGYFTPVATPTDILGIVGSATKTVKVQKITLSNIQTTAGNNKFYLIKRSAADTGSTPVAVTAVPFSSANAAATCVVQQYGTTNPTTGAAVGTIVSPDVLAPAAATASGGANFVLFDAKTNGQPILLRGVAEELDVNFNGAAVPAGFSCTVDVQLCEE